MDGSRLVRIIPLFLFVLIIVGCSSTEESPVAPVPASVEIEMTSDPTVTFNQATGKTTNIVQFIARDRAGNPLDANDVIVELRLDNSAVDNEALLQADSAELTSSINLALVLDASYSMLLHSPPAFEPMLTAARDAVAEGLELYEGRPGTFFWGVSWFSETIASPGATGRTWQPDDLLTIPEPDPGTATKLFAAVERQAKLMREQYLTIANGPHDHHVMIVLSDGADNYSWFDNESFTNVGVTTSGAPYDITGWVATDVDPAVAAIEGHPNLTVHALGLGSSVQDSQLQALVTAGGGRYLKNPSSTQLGALFDSLTREFATIQDHGATIPLPPGDYSFTLRVRTAKGNASDEYSFQFHGGDEGAGVLP
jgi:hypothetical protein